MTMYKIFFALAAAAFLPFVVSRSLTDKEGDTEIWNGSPAEAGEFPSFALLCYSGTTTACGGCGGVLITNKHVLTAAHCVVNSTVTGVRIGAALSRSDGEYFSVTNVVSHPDYINTQTPFRIDNDVAVITLSEEVTSTCGRPASFNRDAATTDVDAQELTTIGYGHYDSNAVLSDYLRKTTVTSYTDAACGAQAQVAKFFYDGATMLCAYEPGTANCRGDSGGPLFDCSGTVLGLVSFIGWVGEPCESETINFYTEVATFKDWIDAQAPCSNSFRWECGTAALRKVMKWFGYLGDDSN